IHDLNNVHLCGPERIKRMDAAGIDMQVLSHAQPGIEVLEDAATAVQLSKEINDWLGNMVQKYPSRLAGFATLPTQSPKDAADELERTVKQYGFKGALINGHTNGRYLDHESFYVLLKMAEFLDVPIYIHPTDPPREISETYYQNSTTLITGWAWSVETATHLLRMIVGGVFDRHPKLKIIIGHMGELIPFCYSRLSVALSLGEWMLAAQDTQTTGSHPTNRMEKSFDYYMKENVYVTTSGVFDQSVFACALDFLGIDNLLFSVDDPYRDNFEAMEFLGACNLSARDKEKLAFENAAQLLKISTFDSAKVNAFQSSIQRNRFSPNAFRARMKSKIGRAMLSFLVK
ncbi:MAG: amidohydrolase family protein, partial [Chloroflexi bacterium]|nr:amidohydrolase family protein [Chloroflexota bacterium]